MPPLSLLIKPASGLCNLRCSYCFYHDVAANREIASYGIMTEETLGHVLKKALEAAEDEIIIAYQGGEPTLAGLDFFKKSVALQGEYNRKKLRIHNAIQTNGIGLDADWADFFRENNFLVGLSLDGIMDVHDRHRVDAGGAGSFSDVMDTVALFDCCGVSYNILAVVTLPLARRIRAAYKFFRRCGFEYLQFIPCLDPLGAPFGGHDYSLTPAVYGRFLCELFDLWYADMERGPAPSIRDFDNYVQMLMGYPPESCNLRGVCGMQYVVEADGAVYPCDFYVLDEMRLGNLNEVDFDKIDRRRAEIRFIEASEPLDPACAGCEYLPICRGGCRRHRETGSGLGRTYFCEAYKMFFAHALGRLEGIARAALARL
jgi:uncharacterized protein